MCIHSIVKLDYINVIMGGDGIYLTEKAECHVAQPSDFFTLFLQYAMFTLVSLQMCDNGRRGEGLKSVW